MLFIERDRLDKYLSSEELDVLEEGLQELVEKHRQQKHQEFNRKMQNLSSQLNAMSKPKKSFNEVSPHTSTRQEKQRQDELARQRRQREQERVRQQAEAKRREEEARQYEREQKAAEQEWLKKRERLYATKSGYETKVTTKPYVSLWR